MAIINESDTVPPFGGEVELHGIEFIIGIWDKKFYSSDNLGTEPEPMERWCTRQCQSRVLGCIQDSRCAVESWESWEAKFWYPKALLVHLEN